LTAPGRGIRLEVTVRLTIQIVGAVLLVSTSYVSVERIAEAKNETAAGGSVFRLDEKRAPELAAFGSLRSWLVSVGESGLSDRLERLRENGEVWVAPRLGPERWAVFVDTLSLVRRIYVRRAALLDPRTHLYPTPHPDVPESYQKAFASVSLAGALRHEVAHRDGITTEGGAYEVEIAWYEGLRQSAPIQSMTENDRRVWEWALESAILSARKASATAAAG
jgi:hypothetical protein